MKVQFIIKVNIKVISVNAASTAFIKKQVSSKRRYIAFACNPKSFPIVILFFFAFACNRKTYAIACVVPFFLLFVGVSLMDWEKFFLPLLHHSLPGRRDQNRIFFNGRTKKRFRRNYSLNRYSRRV